MEMQFEGLEDLNRQMQQMEENVKNDKEKALKTGAKVMQEATERSAPVRAVNGGTLKANIEISDIENEEIEVYVDNQGVAYYGYMLEIGTSKMSARPFMGPAFNQNTNKIEQAMANSLRQSLGLG